jgi:EAL domain-containing protein (putative c-di-GMP-specific phosphodiesterase class I)
VVKGPAERRWREGRCPNVADLSRHLVGKLLAYSESAQVSAPRGEDCVETVVLIATVLPSSAASDLPATLSAVTSRLFGSEHVLDLAIRDHSSVAITLGMGGAGGGRVADPALAPALEAELHAALRAAGHMSASVAVSSVGPPMSWPARTSALWEAQLSEVLLHAIRLAEDGSYRKEIAHILEAGAMRTVFQPIVSAQDHTILGYEALSRGPAGHRWERPDLLLDASDRAGLGALIQWEMQRLARLRAGSALSTSDGLLFVNAPDTRFWPDARSDARDVDASMWPWNRVVTEVSERMQITNLPEVWAARDRGRELGIRFALDDVGAGYAGLATLALLAPEFVKVDMSIVRDCH